MIAIAIFITVCYFIMIGFFIVGFDRLPVPKKNQTPPVNSFSIIIPFRNEAINLPGLLDSIGSLDYPPDLFEIIFVNDDSNDNYLDLIENFQKDQPNISLQIIESDRQTISPKKDAINTGISDSKFDWMISTDADCTIPRKWLLCFNHFIETTNPNFIAAPVKFSHQNSLIHHFQNLHFMGLMGSTIGSFGIKHPFLCNGANLCYHKKAFFEIEGFKDNDTIASGDDIFLMQKMIKAFPSKVHFLKSLEATVITKSEASWKSFINQQLRWASKSTDYKNNLSKGIAILVFLQNITLLVLLLSTIIWKGELGIYIAILFLSKILVDSMLILKASYFLKSRINLLYFLITSLTHPLFIVFISINSTLKSYQWKGRSFKK